MNLFYLNMFHDPITCFFLTRSACNDGEYGVNCLFNCSGHCLNGEVCNKTDGSCRSCAVGYQGMKCDKGRLHLKHNFVDLNCK